MCDYYIHAISRPVRLRAAAGQWKIIPAWAKRNGPQPVVAEHVLSRHSRLRAIKGDLEAGRFKVCADVVAAMQASGLAAD